MNIFGILLGAAALGSLRKGEAREIRDLKAQLPENERETVLSGYKQLSGQAKNDFKTALRNADMAAASQILGQDLTKYNIVVGKKDEAVSSAAADDSALAANDFAARIDRILAVPTSIDPELVAEAAKRYEAAVPRGSSENISDKTKKLLELRG
ncbi:MAG: hypothetical protein RIN56_07910 [Sporomusaceae bacterium]|nr:hypothetical protein [Sporomusaceae bacterium]